MSESIPDAISLSTLPPDLIRKIIPMIDEPFKTGVNLISRSWHEFEHLRYRPIDTIKIVSVGWKAYRIEVTMYEKDIRHFGWDTQHKITRVPTAHNQVNVRFVEPMQREDIYRMMKSLSNTCSRIKILWLHNIECVTLYFLSNCFGSARIQEMTFNEYIWGGSNWMRTLVLHTHIMPLLKDMAMKHKMEKVYYDGKIQNLSAESSLTPNGISLSTLPPNIIRKIIPMIAEPFKTGVNLISYSWNALEHLRCRSIDTIKIFSDGLNRFNIEVTMFEKDMCHFGVHALNKSRWFHKITAVHCGLHKIKVKFVVPDQRKDLYFAMNALCKGCSEIKLLSLSILGYGTLKCLIDCFGSARIQEMTFCEYNWIEKGWMRVVDMTSHGMAKNMPILKEMTRKHKIGKLYYNGKFQNL